MKVSQMKTILSGGGISLEWGDLVIDVSHPFTPCTHDAIWKFKFKNLGHVIPALSPETIRSTRDQKSPDTPKITSIYNYKNAAPSIFIWKKFPDLNTLLKDTGTSSLLSKVTYIPSPALQDTLFLRVQGASPPLHWSPSLSSRACVQPEKVTAFIINSARLRGVS